MVTENNYLLYTSTMALMSAWVLVFWNHAIMLKIGAGILLGYVALLSFLD